MAQVIGQNQVKLDNGSTVTAQQGGWYDGQQFWGGTLSQAGVINKQSNQQGAGQAVSSEVNRQSDVAQGLAPGTIDQYVAQQNQRGNYASPGGQTQVPRQTQTPGTSGADISASFTPQATINLPDLYNNLYKSSGISDLEKEYSDKEKAYIEAKGVVNDNPFLSEADRTGRVAKLETLFAERTANLKNDIATKKADIETKLNLELKQLDINSDATRLAWDQFNTLLSSGALDNASGEAIANITRATGIDSSMIYSAIDANKKKNVSTSVIQSEADSGEVTVSVINTQTGEIISQKSLGKIGNAQTGSSSKMSESEQKQLIKDDIINEIRSGSTLDQVMRLGGSYLDASDILRLYKINNIYGPVEETDEQLLERYGIE